MSKKYFTEAHLECKDKYLYYKTHKNIKEIFDVPNDVIDKKSFIKYKLWSSIPIHSTGDSNCKLTAFYIKEIN